MILRILLLATALFLSSTTAALYDSKPMKRLEFMQGTWAGQLTYDDYSNPGKLVNIPTKMFAALASPNKIILHFSFDDGPEKTVYSYDSILLNASAKTLSWFSGDKEVEEIQYHIISNEYKNKNWAVVFEHNSGKTRQRYTLNLDRHKLIIRKDEFDERELPTFRNEYNFTRRRD